ncbi:hypothetical protein ACQ4M3_05415 [Leptolyngbya sp. AN03gr2]|uniref:hypothetical protein n=1 Tax=unclassified Leptolyngbya TaxID=2650499 RepID=UPI003D320663
MQLYYEAVLEAQGFRPILLITPTDAVVFAVLHEPDYQRLYQWWTQSTGDAFEDWLQSQLVYQFCDTTLGRITKVRNLTTRVQLDLTDYEDW